MLIDTAQIELFVLIFIRVTSALAVMPMFGHAAVPPMVKAGLAGLISLMLTPILAAQMPVPGGTILNLFLPAIREVVCGLLLGFAAQFVFWAVEIAGQLVGFQAGFSVVMSIDPNTESQSTVITQFYNVVAFLIFLSIDGHHVLLRALADSFRTIPVGRFTVDARLSEWMLLAAQGVLVNGIRLAAPLMVTLLLADVGLGILTRVAPTLNVFVLGFPLKVALTLIMISITLSAVVAVFSHQFALFARQMPAFLKLLVAP